MSVQAEAVQATLWDASRSDVDVFIGALAKIPAGQLMSLNDVRDELDVAGVPEKVRPGLMRQACAGGWLEPHTQVVRPGQAPVHLSEPSTGVSARGAHVKLYRRTSYSAAVL